jgi:hypothetical protein
MHTTIAELAQLHITTNQLAFASLPNKKRMLHRRHIARNRLSFKIEKNIIINIPLKIIK